MGRTVGQRVLDLAEQIASVESAAAQQNPDHVFGEGHIGGAAVDHERDANRTVDDDRDRISAAPRAERHVVAAAARQSRGGVLDAVRQRGRAALGQHAVLPHAGVNRTERIDQRPRTVRMIARELPLKAAPIGPAVNAVSLGKSRRIAAEFALIAAPVGGNDNACPDRQIVREAAFATPVLVVEYAVALPLPVGALFAPVIAPRLVDERTVPCRRTVFLRRSLARYLRFRLFVPDTLLRRDGEPTSGLDIGWGSA